MVPNAICIVAKCPIPGKSKTRLSAAAAGGGGLTDEGCALIAKSMLCDVLSNIHRAEALSSVVKFLYFAPADDDGKQRMGLILDELGILYVDGSHILKQADHRPGILDNAGGPSGRGLDVLRHDKWYLCPMPDARQSNLRSSDLGGKLAGMLDHTRSIVWNDFGDIDAAITPPAVAFLGMDSPELPVGEILYALQLASRQLPHSSAKEETPGSAYINPSHDGGYGMLCLPPQAPASVFEGVRWSDPLTAISQMKALSDEGIPIVIGSLMRDIDEMEDLMGLAERLRIARKNTGSADEADKERSGDILCRPPKGREIEAAQSDDNMCRYSWEAIQQLQI